MYNRQKAGMDVKPDETGYAGRQKLNVRWSKKRQTAVESRGKSMYNG